MAFRWKGAAGIAMLCLVAALPFIPRGWLFLQEGVPEGLFSGETAALELRVLHAERGVQASGPYAEEGWSHPGPAYFYLALPVYEALGRRGPSLNVFAFLANFAAFVAIVLTARRLRGSLFAIAVAALLSVYAVVGVPALLTDQRNALLPILPFVLTAILTARVAAGATGSWPVLVFIASAVVQTHVAYTLPVGALLVTAFAAGRRLSTSRTTLIATAIVVALCWALPLYDAIAGDGNLPRLVAAVSTGAPAQQSWGDAIRVTAEQLSILPLALLQTLRLDVDTAAGLRLMLAATQALGAAALFVYGRRRADRVLTQLAAITLMLMAVALVAARADFGWASNPAFAWISAIGVLAWTTVAAWAMPPFERALLPRNARALTVFAAVGLIALANAEGDRPRVYGERDVTVDALATAVEERLRATASGTIPVAHIESHDTWPAAIAVVLHLYKRGMPIAVEESWLPVVGRQLAAPRGDHPRLVFGDVALRDRAAESKLTYLGDLGWVYVYLEGGPERSARRQEIEVRPTSGDEGEARLAGDARRPSKQRRP
jgi:hypothetical protein